MKKVNIMKGRYIVNGDFKSIIILKDIGGHHLKLLLFPNKLMSF